MKRRGGRTTGQAFVDPKYTSETEKTNLQIADLFSNLDTSSKSAASNDFSAKLKQANDLIKNYSSQYGFKSSWVTLAGDTANLRIIMQLWLDGMPDRYDYHCLTTSRINHNACPGILIYEDALLSAVTDILLKNLDAALGRYALTLTAPTQQEVRQVELKEKIAAKQQARTKLRGLNRGLYENLTLGVIDRDDYFSLRERYAAQISQVDDELQQLNEGLALLDERRKQYQSLKKDARSIREDRALTAELIDRLIERIEVSPDKHITVRFKFQSEFDRYGEALEKCKAM